MTIDDLHPKIKSFIDKPIFKRFSVMLVIVLLMTVSFGLGKLSVLDKEISPEKAEVSIYLPNGTRYTPSGVGDSQNASKLANLASFTVNSSEDTSVSKFRVFGSKNGKNYYFADCPAGNTVKEENKVWFDDPEKAEKAGYTKSTRCK